MSDLAATLTVRDDILRQGGNLRIAKRELMSLNAAVDLSRSQTRHPKLPASAGGVKP